MKSFKIVLVVFAGLLGLVVLLLAIGLVPSVQTWAVRRAVADQPGMEIRLGQVAAGFSSARLDDVKIAQPGAVVRVKSVEVHYSAWDYLTKHLVNVESLTIDGLEIDLRSSASAPVAASSTATTNPTVSGASQPATPVGAVATSPSFDGLLRAAQLPLDLILTHLTAQGRALLPDGRDAVFTVEGSDLATGRTGTVTWTATYQDPAAAAAVQSVQNEGSVAVRLTTDRRVERVGVDSTIALRGPQLPTDRIRAQVTAEAAGGGETYAATFSLVRGTGPSATSVQLFKSDAAFDPAAQSIGGTWSVTAGSAQLGALLTGLGLPEVDLDSTGRFTWAPARGAASWQGDLQARVARLEAVSPELTAIGAVSLHTKFEGALADEVVSLTRLELVAADAAGRTFAEVHTLQPLGFALGDQRVTVPDASQALASIALKQLPLAWAQPWVPDQRIESGTLSLALTVAATTDGRTITVRAIEPVALHQVTVSAGDQKWVEGLEFSVTPRLDYTAEQLSADLSALSITLPTGDAVSGRVKVDVSDPLTKPAVTFSTQLDARLLTVVQPYAPLDPGPLALTIAAEGTLTNNVVLSLQRAALVVNRIGNGGNDAPLLLAADLLQPVRANLDSLQVIPDRPTATLARVKLGALPLAWAEPFVPDLKLAGTVSGGTLEVGLKALDDVFLTTTEPLTVKGISATLAGQPQAKDLDLALELSATLHGEAVTYEVRRLAVTGPGGGAVATVNAAGEATLGDPLTVSAKGKLEADVAALAQQPALAGLVAADRGVVAATFDATMRGAAVEAQVNATLRNAVATQGKIALADVDLALTTSLDAAGHGKVTLPVIVVAGKRRSDVTIAGTFTLPPASSDAAPAPPGAPASVRFDGQVTSTLLVVDDLQAFAALLPAAAAPAPAKSVPAPPTKTMGARLTAAAGAALNVAPAVPAKAPRDETPFWQGVTGEVTLDLQEVHQGPDTVIKAIRGTARISDTRVALDGLEARLKDDPVKITGGITFDAQATRPYAMTGVVDVKGLAVGPLLQPPSPQQRPPLEATVGLGANVNGQGGTLPELLQNAYGTVDVNGTAGVLRMLGKRGETIGKVSALVGLVGALQGSDRTMAATELASAFNELKFDRFKMKVERGADLNLKFSNIEFVSPIMRLSGTGSLTAKEGVALENQPMTIVLTLGGKGTLAQLLGKAGLLSGETDDQGYALISQKFTVGGTPANADPNAFWRMVAEAGLRAAAGFRAN